MTADPQWVQHKLMEAMEQLKTLKLGEGGALLTQDGICQWAKEHGHVTVSTATVSRWTNGNAMPDSERSRATLAGVFTGLQERHRELYKKAPLPAVLHPDRCRELLGLLKVAEAAKAQQRKLPRQIVYPGLAPYTSDQAAVFFGRGQDVARMITRLDRTYRAPAPTPVLLLAGGGVGKSSYLAAGVKPALANRGLPSNPAVREWPSLLVTPGLTPLATLLDAVPQLRHLAADTEPGCDVIRTAVQEHPDETGIVLIIDQFEELFQDQIGREERARYGDVLATLAAAPEPGVRPFALVLIGCRADFYPRLNEVPALREARREIEALEHLTEPQLREVLTEPGRLAVTPKMPPELVERILGDLKVTTHGSDGGQLPLLAHVLAQMNKANKFSLAHYEKLQGLTGAVSETAAEVWRTITSAGLEDVATDVLLRLVAVGDSPSQDTRRYVRLEELLAGPAERQIRRTLDILSGPTARLIVDDGQRVTLVHESLLRLWPQLQRTVDAERDDLRAHRKLEDRAHDWTSAGRHRDDLDRGGRLREAQRVMHRWPVSNAVEEFIAAAGRHDRRRRAVMTSVVILLCVLVAALGVAVIKQHKANTDLIFTDVVRAADGLRDQNASLAAQLYLSAYRLRPTDELYTDLLSTQAEALSSPLANGHGMVRAVTVTPDGGTAMLGDADGTVELWDIRDRAAMHPWGPPLPGAGHDTKSVAVTPDGRTVIAGDASGTIRMWDVTNPARPVPLIPPRPGIAAPPHGRGLFSGVLSIAVTPDGHHLLFGGSDGSIHRWDITDPHHPHEADQPITGDGAVTALAISKDGRTLAASRISHTLTLVDLSNATQLRLVAPAIPVGTKPVYAVAYSPSNVLATAGTDGLVRLWTESGADHLIPLGTPLPGAANNAVFGLQFSPDGTVLATAGADNHVRLFNVANPDNAHLIGDPLGGHTRGVAAIAFAPDGRTLISGSADATARVWTLPRDLVGHRANVAGVAVTADGTLAASASQDGTVRVWSIKGAATSPLGAPTLVDPAGVVTVALAPDAATMATGSVSGTLQLWSMRDPGHPTPLGPPLIAHGRPIYGLAFNSDGRTLASAGADNLVHLWTIGAGGGTPAATFSPDGRTHTAGGAPDGVGAVEFTPAGHILVAGAPDNSAALWDVSDASRPRLLSHTTAHSAFIKAVAISPDGTTLATGSADHTIDLVDIHDPNHPVRWGRPLTGHRNPVTSLDFNSGGQKLISGGDDGRIIIWDLRNRSAPDKIGDPLRFGTGPVRAVKISSLRNLVVSGGRDSLVHVWSIDSAQAIDRICRETPNTLTEKLWDEYVPSASYDPPCP